MYVCVRRRSSLHRAAVSAGEEHSGARPGPPGDLHGRGLRQWGREQEGEQHAELVQEVRGRAGQLGVHLRGGWLP